MCFVHGTALKLYKHEKNGLLPNELPLRFLPYIQASNIFEDPRHHIRRNSFGVDACVAISATQVDELLHLFPSFPRERVLVNPNGYNNRVFQPRHFSQSHRDTLLRSLATVPYEGSTEAPRQVVSSSDNSQGFSKVVVFCGKFAEWKRLACLLRASAKYERLYNGRVATLIVGTGPLDEQKKMQDLARHELQLSNCFFLGPKSQTELAADIGCFPSRNEPFGLVFIEAMACGTPVIGANSGGPRDFVTDDVGALVDEDDAEMVLSERLAETIERSLLEDWKSSKGRVAAFTSKEKFSVTQQCLNMIEFTENIKQTSPEFLLSTTETSQTNHVLKDRNDEMQRFTQTRRCNCDDIAFVA